MTELKQQTHRFQIALEWLKARTDRTNDSEQLRSPSSNEEGQRKEPDDDPAPKASPPS